LHSVIRTWTVITTPNWKTECVDMSRPTACRQPPPPLLARCHHHVGPRLVRLAGRCPRRRRRSRRRLEVTEAVSLISRTTQRRARRPRHRRDITTTTARHGRPGAVTRATTGRRAGVAAQRRCLVPASVRGRPSWRRRPVTVGTAAHQLTVRPRDIGDSRQSATGIEMRLRYFECPH